MNSASGNPCGSAAAIGTRGSKCRTTSYDRKPTAPPVNRGSPSSCASLYRDSSFSISSSGSEPSLASAYGPQRSTRYGSVPMKLYRASRSPPSTDSSRNEWSPPATFRYADTGVSRSAATSRYTGARFASPRFASSWISLNDGVYILRSSIVILSAAKPVLSIVEGNLGRGSPRRRTVPAPHQILRRVAPQNDSARPLLNLVWTTIAAGAGGLTRP